MAKHQVHSIEFKRQLIAEYAAGKTLYAFGKRHDINHNWYAPIPAVGNDRDACHYGVSWRRFER